MAETQYFANYTVFVSLAHKPSNNITVWVAFQRFHLTIILCEQKSTRNCKTGINPLHILQSLLRRSFDERKMFPTMQHYSPISCALRGLSRYVLIIYSRFVRAFSHLFGAETVCNKRTSVRRKREHNRS